MVGRAWCSQFNPQKLSYKRYSSLIVDCYLLLDLYSMWDLMKMRTLRSVVLDIPSA